MSWTIAPVNKFTYKHRSKGPKRGTYVDTNSSKNQVIIFKGDTEKFELLKWKYVKRDKICV